MYNFSICYMRSIFRNAYFLKPFSDFYAVAVLIALKPDVRYDVET